MSNSVNILIVEDDAVIALDIQNCLRKLENIQLKVAHNYNDAMLMLKKYEFHLAILDINLNATFGGIEIASFIKENLKFPFMFLTSYSDDLTFAEASNCLPVGYIVKPFNRNTLISTVKLILMNHVYQRMHLKVSQVDSRTIQSKKIIEVLEMINDNIHKPITTTDMASHIGWDRSHFSRVFKKEVGVNPKDYIEKKKLEKTIELMKNQNIKLTAISESLGFESYSSFVAFFKKHTGYLPSDYQIGQ